jgi:hypothetical protein
MGPSAGRPTSDTLSFRASAAPVATVTIPHCPCRDRRQAEGQGRGQQRPRLRPRRTNNFINTGHQYPGLLDSPTLRDARNSGYPAPATIKISEPPDACTSCARSRPIRATRCFPVPCVTTEISLPTSCRSMARARLSRELPTDLQASLPTVEEIEAELGSLQDE